MSRYTDTTNEDWHVVPMGDLREHVSSSDCWCKPESDAGKPGLYIHNSMDRREHTIEKGVTQ
jgi:hypothetical protein